MLGTESRLRNSWRFSALELAAYSLRVQRELAFLTVRSERQWRSFCYIGNEKPGTHIDIINGKG